LAGLEKLSELSPNDPNIGEKMDIIKKRISASLRRWEAQGNKDDITSILSQIDQLSRGGMPEYVSNLRDLMKGNKIIAALFATDDEGVSLIGEEAYYTALRPNGILNSKSLMNVNISTEKTKTWKRFKSKKISGSAKGLFSGLPFTGSAKGKKTSTVSENGFTNDKFSISYDIVQGIVDRQWCDLAFLESGAYTTIDPSTKKKLDNVKEISRLSDGKIPPEKGSLRVIPMTVYFVRNLTVQSSAISAAIKQDVNSFSGSAGFSFLGFGAGGSKSTDTTKVDTSRAKSEGVITLEGTYLIAMASRYLGKAPNPDFESHPNAEDWI